MGSRMKTILFLLFLAVGFSAVTYGQKIDVNPHDAIKYTVTCETSDGSPLLHHLYEVADMVHTGSTDDCYQSNGSDSFCTKIEEGMGARISICGPNEKSYHIPCQDVVDMTRAVAHVCSNGVENAERAGGKVHREFSTSTGWDEDPLWVAVSTKP